MVMNRNRALALLALAGILTLSACGNNESNNDPIIIIDPDQGVVDMATDQGPADMGATDMAVEEDIPTFGDDLGGDMSANDAVRQAVIEAWPLHDAVSTGAIEVTEEDGVFTATIDAAAGGSQQSRNNPFVYLDLNGGAKVAITDLASLDDTTWDLAFKRYVIRTNSADGGPGQSILYKRVDTTLEAETALPTAEEASAVDDTIDDNLDPILDPINIPVTAFNYLNISNPSGSANWYSYEGGVSPVAGDIYILRDAAGQDHFKLEIISWTSGVFTLRWAKM